MELIEWGFHNAAMEYETESYWSIRIYNEFVHGLMTQIGWQ